MNVNKSRNCALTVFFEMRYFEITVLKILRVDCTYISCGLCCYVKVLCFMLVCHVSPKMAGPSICWLHIRICLLSHHILF